MPTSAPPPPDYALLSLSPESLSAAAEAAFLDEEFGDAQEPSSVGPSRTKRDESHIRRPANPFILFACDYRKNQVHRCRNNRQLSREAGLLWKLMSEPEKNEWVRLGSEVKEDHAEKNPEYRYKPRRRDVVRFPPCSDASKDDSGVYFFPSPPSQKSSAGARSSLRSPRKKANSKEVPSTTSTTGPALPQQFNLDTHRQSPSPGRSTNVYEDVCDDDFFEALRECGFVSGPAAKSYRGISQRSIDSPENDPPQLCSSQWVTEPGKVAPPRFDMKSRFPPSSFTTNTPFDQPFVAGSSNSNLQSSAPELEVTPFFNFGLPVQAGFTSTATLDPTFDLFFR